jgi:hypothetical protein
VRSLRLIIKLLIGLVLLGVAQWAASGPQSPAAQVPQRLQAAIPLAALLLFGLYLAAGFGGAPGIGGGLLSAAVALAVAAAPFAYSYGVAQRYGLPADAGTIGALLSGPVARGAAALWFAVALVQAFRPARGRLAAPRPQPAAAPVAAQAPAPEPADFWSPAPALQPADPAPAAYAPAPSAPSGRQ